MTWTDGNRWSGNCPRCGLHSYFAEVWQHQFREGQTVCVVECPGGHAFVVEHEPGFKNRVKFVYPVISTHQVPSWLPENYREICGEMYVEFNNGNYRSSVALAGIMLDALVNAFLKSPSDAGKSLKKRLELLKNGDAIDADQFADSTVARLGRNDVMHPDDLAAPVTKEDANEVIDAVISALEGFYKFRRARALPAAKQASVQDEPTATEEEPR